MCKTFVYAEKQSKNVPKLCTVLGGGGVALIAIRCSLFPSIR